ncbi:MAG TPA: hypothetical protein VK768_01545 [Chthoniobacterales bacterium]|nr:hypothetical protein [Chthoniobacterales bacterium]
MRAANHPMRVVVSPAHLAIIGILKPCDRTKRQRTEAKIVALTG